MKKRLLQSGITLATLLLVTLAGEVVVRCLVYVPRGTPYVAETPDTIFQNKPDIVGRHVSPGEFDYEFRTNSQGLRARKTVAAHPSVPRILCLGDSFTFGVGVADQETWPARLESLLAGTGRPSEVVNAGVMGWGLAEYWIWAGKNAKNFRPRLIIVGCHASDWENAYNGLVTLDSEGRLEKHPVIRKDVSRLKAVAEKIPFYDFLVTHSALAALCKESVVRLTWTGTAGGMAGGPPEDAEGLVEQAAPVNRALLEGLQREAAAAEAALLLVFIPSAGEMEWDDQSQHNFSRFRRLFLAWADDAGIPCLDATQLLRSHLKEHDLPVRALYHPVNGHCTSLGYEVIARGMVDLILQHPAWLKAPISQ